MFGIESLPMIIGAVVLGIFGLVVLFSSFFTVDTQTVRMVTRFGKFKRVATDGLNFKVPFIEAASAPLSLRTEQHNVKVDSITKDKVSVTLTISVQSQVIPAGAFDAFYKLGNPTAQIESYVFDAVRGTVPEMDLDQVFQNKGQIAAAVQGELTTDMTQFGYQILKALVTEVEPDAKVVAAMNDINAAQREQVAATARGEAAKTLAVKAAEAEKETKRLRGEGVAAEREAIAKGIKDSAAQIKDALGDVGSDEIMRILLTTQGYDAMRDIAGNAKATVVFVPNSAHGLQELLSAQIAGKSVNDSNTGK